ncbi:MULTISPECIES: DUF262 domain-containing protein [unclassified Acinetobacter]|uniref:DUF262 domain-containing protein n=1 Tax=unclassified Acinetobacter TaxID=196816 RepID=UPI0015D14E6B|nr:MULTISPECIES: DUF262 domain-containing protein [unclassified Acinetobacter]
MENTIHTLQNIFKISIFSIPQYQRAYAWEKDKQLPTYLDDLRQQAFATDRNQEKSYFLGTLLLHQVDPLNNDKNIHVVDGQQRLTTSVIFIAAALNFLEKNKEKIDEPTIKLKSLYRNFIFDDDEEVHKFNTIQEDNAFFRSAILKTTKGNTTEASPSSKRLKEAYDFFSNEVKPDEWIKLLKVLINAKVMVYSVQDSADATLIFELQNDRGKRLTDLEALKSYLMHLIYLHAKNPNDSLAIVQTHFSNIYRCIERQLENKLIPNEDSILSYHAVSYLSWQADEWRHPKDLIKKIIQGMEPDLIQNWVLEFVSNLEETYKVFTKLFDSLDTYTEFTHLLMVKKMAVFWPLVIKTFALDQTENKKQFCLVMRLMEVFAVRGYALSGIRSDAGLSTLYASARDFQGNYKDLQDLIFSMSSWWGMENRFTNSIESPTFYNQNRIDATYILWRYENYLRSQTGRKVEHLSWKHYLKPKDNASKLSLEHIAARNNPISNTVVEWDQGEQKNFYEVATHRIGNLVIDSISANSLKGDYDFSDKLDALSTHSTFLSQGELTKYALKEDDIYYWTIDSIKNRQKDLIAFIKETWNPEKYYRLIDSIEEDELQGMVTEHEDV